MEDQGRTLQQQRTSSPRATLGIYTHRHSDYLQKLLFSIGKMTKETVDIRLHMQPANVHDNMWAVSQDVNTEFFIWMDEDIQLLTEDWLPKLLSNFEDPTVGMVTCAQVKDAHLVDRAMALSAEVVSGSVEMAWAPGHLFCIRSELLHEDRVEIDRKIPGNKGMSDLDVCLQVRDEGFKLVQDDRVVVWHPHKPSDDAGRIADQQPTMQEESSVFEAQARYMYTKWADYYLDAMNNNMIADTRDFR